MDYINEPKSSDICTIELQKQSQKDQEFAMFSSSDGR